MKIFKNKKAIFVDYFDTLVKTTASHIVINKQVCKVIMAKYPFLKNRYTIEQFQSLRDKARWQSRKFYDDAPYRVLVSNLYDYIEGSKYNVKYEDFYSTCYNAYVSVIIGCQYRNSIVYESLRKNKEYGIKIYLVSDFYLPVDAYELFLKSLKCRDLFDGIYISSSCNKSKFRGTIYKFILGELGLNATEVVMIGDNSVSDVKNARNNGIQAYHYLPFLYKVRQKVETRWLNISPLNYIKKKICILNRDTPFVAYSIAFYYFVKELYSHAKNDEVDKLCFLSRDGKFLKTLFDAFQGITINDNNKLRTCYCINSRQANKIAETENEEDILKEYMRCFIGEGGILAVVDNGWKCTSQISLAKILECKTIGYYIGVNSKKNSDDESCIRNGLLFDIDVNGEGGESPYYYLLEARCKLIYEQLLTTDQGTLKKYCRNTDGRVVFDFVEEPSNVYVYQKYAKDIQEHILLMVKGISAWLIDCNLSIKELSSIIVNLLSCQSIEDTVITSDVLNNRYEYYDDVNNVCEYSKDSLHVSASKKVIKDVLIEFLKHPAKHIHVVVGARRLLHKKRLVFWMFKLFEKLYYGYVKLYYNL